MDEVINLENFCSVNFIMDSSKSNNSLSIPKNAWKLLIQVYGKEIKKFTDARRLLEEQLNAGKSPSPQPTQTLPDIPKVDVLPKQYKAQTKVNLLSQEPRDTPPPDFFAPDRQACSVRVKDQPTRIEDMSIWHPLHVSNMSHSLRFL